MDFRAKIQSIANYHGYNTQSRQLIEEMGELTQAINKFWRNQLKCGKVMFSDVHFDTQEEKNIIEEIADVEVCLEQVKFILQCGKEVSKIKKEKVDRELERIANETAKIL